MPKVLLYSTSYASTLKMKTDISRFKQLLLIKKVEYEEIDLASDPQKRRDMLAVSKGCSVIPQLHFDDNFVGDWDTVQDLEDFGELEAALQGSMQDLASIAFDICQGHKIQALRNDMPKSSNPHCIYLLSQTAATLATCSSRTWAGSAAQVCQDLAWEKLHTGDWKHVSVVWRDLYSLTCIVAALTALQQQRSIPDPSSSCLQEHPETALPPASSPSHGTQAQVTSALRELDMAAMMGGPLFRPEIDQLTTLAQMQHQKLTTPSWFPPNKRQKVRETQDTGCIADSQAQACVTSHRDQAGPSPAGSQVHVSKFVQPQQARQQAQPKAQMVMEPEASALLPSGSLQKQSTAIPVEDTPSLERFLVDYMLAADEGQPVILHGVMSAWPALSKWQDLEYLSQVAGPRTVPVEMGKHYLHEGWGQQLMLFSTFIKLHVLQEAAQHPQQPSSCAAPGARAAEQLDTSSACAACESLSEGSSDVQPAPAGSPTEQQQQHQLGYLAQHPLFDQIPALKMDIMEPEYCSLGEGEMQSINAWFGPADTVTPLHHDPHYNLLAQVVGSKYVRLYHPRHTAQLHPYNTGLTQNSSQIDVFEPDHSLYPEFAALPFLDCILQPGQMLFIPPGWWHYVKALSVSFSVSFWWK